MTLLRSRSWIFSFGAALAFGSLQGPDTSAAEPGEVQASAENKRSEISVSADALQTWGWILAQQRDVYGAELNAEERAAFLRGVTERIEGKPSPYDFHRVLPDIDRMAHARRERINREILERNKAEARAFFVQLDHKEGVERLPSGLRVEMVRAGEGAPPKPEQTVKLRYIGQFLDGTEFVQYGPADLILVANRVEPAIFEGVQKIGLGGEARIYVPPEVAEESPERPGVPPGVATYYDIEVLESKATPPEELANALLPPAPAPEPSPASGYTDLQIIENWGWGFAKDIPPLKQDELSAFLKGVDAGIRREAPPLDPTTVVGAMREFVKQRRASAMAADKAQKQAESERFFSGLKSNSRVVVLPSGLRYEILRKGSGPVPKPGEIVVVDYVGRLIDGTIFDRSENEPLHIEVGRFLAGWDEGIQKISRGGKIKLYIPAELGYGENKAAGVPPNSTLIYEIELLEIRRGES